MKELNVAWEEFYEAIRSKRFLGLLFLYLAFILLINHVTRSTMIDLAGQTRITPLRNYGVDLLVAKTPITLSMITNLQIITIFGALIGITLGADAVNREISEGTGKTLLSQPIYRDQIINGKFLGNALALIIIIFLGFTLSITYLLIIGVPLDLTSLTRSLISTILTLIYILSFLSLGVMISTIIKKPETAILVGIAIVIFLTIAYPIIAELGASQLAGERPDHFSVERGTSSEQVSEPEDKPVSIPVEDPYKEWKEKRDKWRNRLYSLSPAHHYSKLVGGAFAGDEYTKTFKSIGETIPLVINNLAIIAVQLLLPFSIAYTRFIKKDLR